MLAEQPGMTTILAPVIRESSEAIKVFAVGFLLRFIIHFAVPMGNTLAAGCRQSLSLGAVWTSVDVVSRLLFSSQSEQDASKSNEDSAQELPRSFVATTIGAALLLAGGLLGS